MRKWQDGFAALVVAPLLWIWQFPVLVLRVVAGNPGQSLNIFQAVVAAFAAWASWQAATAAWEAVKEARKQLEVQQTIAEAERRSRRPYFRVSDKRLEDDPSRMLTAMLQGQQQLRSDRTVPPGEDKHLAVQLTNQGASPAAAFHAEISVIEDPASDKGASPHLAVGSMHCPMFSRAQDVAPGDTVLLGCPVYVPAHTLVAVRVYYVDAFTGDPTKAEDELCQFFSFRLTDGIVREADISSALMMAKWKEDTPCGPRMPQWLKQRMVTPPRPPAR